MTPEWITSQTRTRCTRDCGRPAQSEVTWAGTGRTELLCGPCTDAGPHIKNGPGVPHAHRDRRAKPTPHKEGHQPMLNLARERDRARHMTRRTNTQYARDLGIQAAEMEAARICLEAGATPEQAREATAGNPALDGLAEAMEQQAGAA